MKSFWWITLPKKLGWISNWFTQILTDGYYLITFNQAFKKWLSPAALILGFLIGALHLGYTVIPVETPVIFYAFLATGILSSHLGLLLLLGFAIGDLTVLPEYLNDPSKAILPYKGISWILFAKIHEYIIFGIGIVLVPIISKLSVASIARNLLQKKPNLTQGKIGGILFLGTLSLVSILLVVILIYFWSTAMALMIRTIHLHTFIGRRPEEIVQFFQERWYWLMLLSGIAMIIRITCQWFSLFNPSMIASSEQYERTVEGFYDKSGIFDSSPIWIRAITKACFLTFLLAGAFFIENNPVEFDHESCAKFSSLAFCIFLINGYVTKLKLWPEGIIKFWRLSIWIRAIIAIILTSPSMYAYTKYLHKTQTNFWGILMPILVSLLIFSLLLPQQRTKSNKHEVH